MEKVLETILYCHQCKCSIRDEEIADMECAYSCAAEPWEEVEIVMRSKKKEQVKKALRNLERACEKISAVNAEPDEY